jgi:hypothetical protein
MQAPRRALLPLARRWALVLRQADRPVAALQQHMWMH